MNSSGRRRADTLSESRLSYYTAVLAAPVGPRAPLRSRTRSIGKLCCNRQMYRAQYLAAVLAAACCGAASSCDSIAELMGRLAVETATRPRASSGFVTPTLARFTAPALSRRIDAAQSCRHAPSFGLGSSLTFGQGVSQGKDAGPGSFWTEVDSRQQPRGALSSIIMRATKSKKTASSAPAKTPKSSGIVQKPSHQVGRKDLQGLE